MVNGKTVPIEESILVVRGQRVLLAGDLAKIYGVETRVLNQAVKRNRERFPEDFTFRLTGGEASAIAASRSQSVIESALRFYGTRNSRYGVLPPESNRAAITCRGVMCYGASVAAGIILRSITVF